MRFVNLTNYPKTGKEQANIENLKAKKLNGKACYKLENEMGLIWCTKEREDELYCEWETVQPEQCKKYAVYYEPREDSYTVKPKELFEIKDVLKKYLEMEKNLKEVVVNYIRKKYNRDDVKFVICQVDEKMDIADLHTIFDTEEIEKVVKGYAQSFSAVYWNCVDEKDESFFQVPSLMISDSECMSITDTIETIPYQQRKNGTDKKTGNLTREVNFENIVKLLNQDLQLNTAVDLLKLQRDVKNESLSNAINMKLCNYKRIEEAKLIMEQDKLANQIYIISEQDKLQVKNEILENPELQRRLQEDRENHTGKIDIYMGTYVELIEEYNREQYFKQVIREKTIKTEEIEKISNIRNTHQSPIKEWFNRSFSKFRSQDERKL